MAIYSVLEQRGRSGTIGADWKREYTRRFLVITTDKMDDVTVVRTAVDPSGYPFIPTLGSIYTNASLSPSTLRRDFGSYVVSIECTETDPQVVQTNGYDAPPNTGSYWEVTVKYGPYDPQAFDSQNPLDSTEKPKVSWGLSRFTKPFDQDTDGNAVLNSAGDYFDPPIELDDSRLVLRITRNEESYDPDLTNQYKDATNSDEFWDFPPDQVKLMDRSAELQSSGDCPINDGEYWAVSYDFEIRPEGWTKQILDQGCKVLDDSGKLVNATDNDGQPVNSPILLDGNGKKLPEGADPVFLKKKGYKQLPFAVFGLTKRGP